MEEPVKESEIHEQDEAGLAQSRIKQAQALFQTFDKVIQSRKRYSKTHKTAQDLVLQFYHKIRNYLDTFGDLSLVVGEFEFYLDKASIYKNEDFYNSISLLFYRDGIRKLKFSAELTDTEFLKFYDLVESQLEQGSLTEDSILNLLWKEGFQTINYFAVEGISDQEKMGEDFEYELDAYFDEFGKYINKSALDTVQLKEVSSLMVDREAFIPEELIGDSPMEIIDEVELAEVSKLDEAELTRVVTLVQDDDEQVLFRKFVVILLEIINKPLSPELRDNIAGLFDKIITYFITMGNFKQVMMTLSALRKSILTNKNFSKEMYVDIIDKISTDETIENLRLKDSDYWQKNKKALFSFLSILSGDLSKAISETLVGAEEMKGSEEVLFKALIGKGKPGIAAIVALISHEDKTIAQKAIEALKEINDPEVIQMLSIYFNHEDTRVRLKLFGLLQHLSAFNDPAVLIVFLHDPLPKLRRLALNEVRHVRKDSAIFILNELVSEPGFRDRDILEREEVYRIMAMLEPDRLFDSSKKILKKSGWFMTSHTVEDKICAMAALSGIKTEESRSLIEKHTKNRNDKIKNAAYRALKRFKDHGDGR
jgi:hypothetical protein